MVDRLFVEKKPGFDNEARALFKDARSFLGVTNLTGLRLFNRYDVEGLDAALLAQARDSVFSEPQLDDVYDELPQDEGVVFATEYLPGQFDQRADSAAQCIQLMAQCERPIVRTALVYILKGDLVRRGRGDAQKARHQPRGTPRGFSGKAGDAARRLRPARDRGGHGGLHGLWRGGAGRLPPPVRAGDGRRRSGVLPEVLPVRAPRPHADGNSHDRHLLVRSLPPHDLPHRVYRRAL